MNAPVIGGPELRRRLAAGERLWLVHAAGPVSFRSAHLPGAVAFPDDRHLERMLRRDDHVVVYGESHDDLRSRELAAGLHARGYRHARWYAGGLTEWRASGAPVEGGGARPPSRP
ncbi:rhodanese-like domain-containing protein [Egicoccus sp. AB-alg2]|uniref:rhodanese-like domain-containing protein n=1 Tax=Egicoccus sp. AB-alg2 TaxID=3242693 RepID=UPI00359DF7F2